MLLDFDFGRRSVPYARLVRGRSHYGVDSSFNDKLASSQRSQRVSISNSCEVSRSGGRTIFRIVERVAEEVVPRHWVTVLRRLRGSRRIVTVREFFRELAGLGGHLLRKGDGEPSTKRTIYRAEK